jgi:hypothetical protein
MFLRKSLSVVFLILIGLACVYAADITGKWTAQFDTQVGLQKYTYEFNAEGTTLTGKAIGDIAGAKSESVLREGKINGDEISFVEMQQYQGQEVKIAYKGKVSGDEIKFTRTVTDQFNEEFVARRSK